MNQCVRFDKCEKVTIVLGKDLLDSQYLDLIEAVCIRCDDPNRWPVAAPFVQEGICRDVGKLIPFLSSGRLVTSKN